MVAWPSAPAEEVEHSLTVRAVEFAGGLVGEDDAALLGESAGDGDALLLAAGQFLDQMVAAVLQADVGQCLLDVTVDRFRFGALGEQRQREVLPGGQDPGQTVALRDQYDAVRRGRGPVGDRQAVDLDVAGLRPDRAGDGPQQRALAGAGRPADRENEPGRHVQRHVRDGDQFVVGDGEVGDRDHD